MPNLEVTVFSQKIKLSYKNNEKERLINAVKILNETWKKFSHLHGKVSDIKIIILISLELQDRIEDLIVLKNNMLKKEIEKNNNEILKIENMLDNLYDELLDIKKNILNKNHE